MALRDEVVTLLREELGEGYESATLGVLLKAYTMKAILPKLKARRGVALDLTALVAARKSAEDALRTEEATRKAAVAQVEADVDAEIGTV